MGYDNTLQAPVGLARRDSAVSSTMGPGAAGVGAGGQGVESANQNYDQYYNGNGQNGCELRKSFLRGEANGRLRPTRARV
jgi:hypothetical protein